MSVHLQKIRLFATTKDLPMQVVIQEWSYGITLILMG
jgi:hypothetical protein